VNHELRTPLSSIIGYVEIIRDITDNKPELGILKYLEVVDRNANILLELIDGILTLSKLDSNKAPLPNIPVDISQVIDSAISVLEPDCQKSNIDIHFSIARDVGYLIQGDARQLNQVFLNLLSNSIKFSEVNSHIEVEIDKLNYEEAFSFVRVVIRDHGIGIPAKDIEGLFMRFFRATNAVEKQFPGTGLGLAIVEQIVQYHGGNVRVESVEGEGTTIILEFPLYLSQAEKLVMDRRYGVLTRAIATLEISPKQDLYHVTHDIGGSIGFYTFEEESRQILDFSRWLNSGIILNPIEVESRRQSVLAILKSRLASLLEREISE
jgi:signal transduction histidine kinase